MTQRQDFRFKGIFKAVTLSAAKGLARPVEMLRYAQHDTSESPERFEVSLPVIDGARPR